ncbi:nucleobase:cation symporter-2 family protein [Paracoccus sp. DMF-8]|uniref:nucleobase:cation symporter-2 family protein n=1 Tax=Paracoccus sp. DMF-8 TaxID=3019445 RepID=UPI0023E7E0E0|nr:nucleobase:cation symporter-2 family protein [Paracoccus sp. DMF-8]MDF3606399.1 nucleobase:cation symporter-2 family protein [Paracoccus sp. DMF-8]
MQETVASRGFDPVEEMLPAPRLVALGFQHVLVMYAGAIAVPLIVGRALQLAPQDVAFLISADLFVCGIVTIIQSFGLTQYFGIKLPVMMGVTFAAVGPMVAIASSNPGNEGARMMFGAIMAAGLLSIFIAPVIGRLLRFFPSVVTGTVILVIGVSLLPVGINWLFGLPVGPTAPKLVDPAATAWLETARAAGSVPDSVVLQATVPNPEYASLARILIGVVVLGSILLIAKFGRGFVANIAVLLGIVIGGILAAMMGMMNFHGVGEAKWFAMITPLHFGMPIFDPIMILTMLVVMFVTMIESTGMFLALSDICGRKMTPKALTAGLRVDGLGTAIGGFFNTFPYTSFSQNVGLVGVTGVRSRFVCVAAGGILVVLGLTPKMGTLVEALPTTVLGGAGLVMFGMVAATGIRILANVDFKGNKHNLFIVAVSLGLGMIPMIAPDFNQWLPHSLHTLIHSGILLAAIAAVLLNWFFNGAPQISEEDAAEAAKAAEAH